MLYVSVAVTGVSSARRKLIGPSTVIYYRNGSIKSRVVMTIPPCGSNSIQSIAPNVRFKFRRTRVACI
jgi:hypothetical protein